MYRASVLQKHTRQIQCKLAQKHVQHTFSSIPTINQTNHQNINTDDLDSFHSPILKPSQTVKMVSSPEIKINLEHIDQNINEQRNWFNPPKAKIGNGIGFKMGTCQQKYSYEDLWTASTSTESWMSNSNCNLKNLNLNMNIGEAMRIGNSYIRNYNARTNTVRSMENILFQRQQHYFMQQPQLQNQCQFALMNTNASSKTSTNMNMNMNNIIHNYNSILPSSTSSSNNLSDAKLAQSTINAPIQKKNISMQSLHRHQISMNENINHFNINHISSMDFTNSNICRNLKTTPVAPTITTWSNNSTSSLKKNSKVYYNKFNSQVENSTNENTIILALRFKTGKNDFRTYNLRKLDDLFISLQKFFDMNQIKQELVKPIVSKVFEVWNKIFSLYNHKIGIYDQDYLASWRNLWRKNNEKLPSTKENADRESTKHNCIGNCCTSSIDNSSSFIRISTNIIRGRKRLNSRNLKKESLRSRSAKSGSIDDKKENVFQCSI